MDKVKFNLKNVHYAMLTEAAGGTVTFETPEAIPGAVSLSLEPSGETSKFYADGILYHSTTANAGYTGDLEVARIPDKFLTDVFQYTKGETSKVLTEDATKQPKPFALLFEESGDSTGTKFVLYKCQASRPTRELSTNTETVEVKTQKITLTVMPLMDGKVFAMTGDETPSDTVSGWYQTVYREGT